MKKLLLIAMAIILSSSLFAKHVPSDIAKNIAKNVYFEHFGTKQTSLTVKDIFSSKPQNDILYYAVNFEKGGYVIISADDRVYPILGFSDKGKFSLENVAPAFIDWMKHYETEIAYVIDNDLPADTKAVAIWNKYNVSYNNFSVEKGIRNVNPLLGNIRWDQDDPWNDSCPVASGGPGGHAYAGCVATATGQVMKFWEHPEQGNSSHYNYPENETYYNKTYDWSGIPDAYATTATADLLADIGFATDMQYSASGSGTYTSKALSALSSNYWYKSTLQLIYKADYLDDDWQNILIAELDAGRPMLYRGTASDGNGGHSFVCDGYNSPTHFHFNWGWSGSGNDYYYLNNLYYDSFSYNQGAGIGIEPVETAYYVPLNLSATATGNNVHITWEYFPSSTPTFVVYRNGVDISGSLPSTTLSFDDNGLTNGTYKYTVKAYYSNDDTYSNASNEESVTINTVAINKLENEFKIYPNPAKDIINIEFSNEENYTIIITDISGKQIYTTSNKGKFVNYKTENLAKGLYFVNIKLDNKTFTKKIVVQ